MSRAIPPLRATLSTTHTTPKKEGGGPGGPRAREREKEANTERLAKPHLELVVQRGRVALSLLDDGVNVLVGDVERGRGEHHLGTVPHLHADPHK